MFQTERGELVEIGLRGKEGSDAYGHVVRGVAIQNGPGALASGEMGIVIQRRCSRRVHVSTTGGETD